MTLVELPDLLQGSDEWMAQRRGMVTASVVGRLVTTRTRAAVEYGCSDCSAFPMAPCTSKTNGAPIKTVHPARADVARFDSSPPELVVADTDEARGLTALLVAERITGWTEPVYVSDDMWRGTLHEPVARQTYAEHNGVTVTEVGLMIRTEDGWTLGASPDGLIGDDGGLEIKCPRAKTHIRTILRGEIPAQHMAQVQACLLVSGRKWWDFVSFCAGLPMWTKRVYPDPRWHDVIVAAVASFEEAAAQQVADYTRQVEGLPETERISDDIDVVI